jgi:hypothetical protein
MKHLPITLALLTSLALTSCDNATDKSTENSSATAAATPTKVAYSVAQNYFVKNNISSIENPRIETAMAFDSIFGMATTMGEQGKPTAIDFTKQSVLAVMAAETDLLTTLEPISLEKNASNELTLSYKKNVGAKQTYTMKPSFALIIDKAENGNVVLKEVQ